MAVDGVEDVPRLSCGRTIDQVWERVGRPADDHEATCPYCQQARANLAELNRITGELRISDVEDPDLQPGPRLKNSIMDLARAEVRRGRMLPLRPVADLDLGPELAISEQAVAEVVRAAADTLPELRARRCQVRIDDSGGEFDTAVAGAGPGSVAVRIDLTAAVSVRAGVPAVTAELRRRVGERVSSETGLRVQTLNVSVEDVFDA